MIMRSVGCKVCSQPVSTMEEFMGHLCFSPLLINVAAHLYVRLSSAQAGATSCVDLLRQLLQSVVPVVSEAGSEACLAVGKSAVPRASSGRAVQDICTRLVLAFFRQGFFEGDAAKAQNCRDLAAVLGVMPEAGAPSLLFDAAALPLSSEYDIPKVALQGSQLFAQFGSDSVLSAATSALAACGLVERSSDDRRLVMHALVQEAVQAVVRDDPLQSKASSVGSALWRHVMQEVNGEAARDPPRWRRSRQLLPVALHLCDHHLPSEGSEPEVGVEARFFLQVFLRCTGQFTVHSHFFNLFTKTERFLRAALFLSEKHQFTCDTAHNLNLLASLLLSKGPQHFAEVELLHRRSLEIRELLHSDANGRHPDVASSLNDLAILLNSKGPQHFAEAELLHRRSLEIYELLHSNVNGRHPHVALSLNNLAGLLESKGPQHFAEAELLYRRSLEIEEWLHSDVNGQHPDVASSLSNLAALLLELQPRNFPEAESLLARAVRYYLGLWRNSGVLHPQLLNVFIGLLDSFYKQKVDKSLFLLFKSCLDLLQEPSVSVSSSASSGLRFEAAVARVFQCRDALKVVHLVDREKKREQLLAETRLEVRAQLGCRTADCRCDNASFI
jgi:hypothetical protein